MDLNIIKSLFQNTAVLIALIVFFDLLTQHRALSKTILIKLLVGVMVGLLGIAIMITGFRGDSDIIVDSRSILLSVTGLYLGFIPTIIAMFITSIYRIYEGGASIWTGISIIFITGSFGLIVRHFWFHKLDKISILQAYGFGLISHLIMTIVIYFFVPTENKTLFNNITVQTTILFPIISAILIFLLKYRMRRDRISNELFQYNERLNLAMDASHIIFFDRDLITKEITWSNMNDPLLKKVIEITEGNYEQFDKYICKEFLAPLRQKMEKSIQDRKAFNIEIKVLPGDREEYWVYFSGQYFFDKLGMPIRVIGMVKDISKDKKNENALAEKEQNLQTILDYAPDGIFVQSNGVFEFVNPTFVKMLNAKNENELIGTRCFDRISPEYHEVVQERVKNQKETGNKVPLMEQEYIKMDGSKIVVETTASPFKYKSKDAHLVFVHDLSFKKDTEIQINKLFRAVEQSPASIVISDIKGSVEYVNPKFTEVTGYSYQEVVGHNPRILKSGHTSSEEYNEMWKTISNGNVWSGVFLNIKKDGSTYWESATISPIKNKKNEITHYVAVKEDITEKKQIYEDLIIAKNKAEESNQIKSHFLANMSHEIRTPLNGILGFLELIKDESITAKERNDYIDIINKSGIRLLETINDIIEMSKIEAGFSKLEPEQVDVIDLLNDLYRFFKPQTDSKNLQLIPEFQNKYAALKLVSDKNKLNGILTNLIKNAIKFTDSGFIKIDINQSDEGVLFSVSDSGRGIPSDKIEAIFDRFIQSDNSYTRGHEGSGLGLSISSAYVELMGGKIWAESEVEKGSSFHVFLPFICKEEPEVTQPVVRIEKMENVNNQTILIAEDEDDNYQFLNIVLTRLGYHTYHAKTGLEAIHLLESNKEIALVLMDIKMPEMSGIEATIEIRKSNKIIPIIAQSAFLKTGNEDLINENGFTDYLMKPIKKDLLIAFLKKYL
jgi:PAS domain S-box-containing protein